jgi:hypothetical protein
VLSVEESEVDFLRHLTVSNVNHLLSVDDSQFITF